MRIAIVVVLFVSMAAALAIPAGAQTQSDFQCSDFTKQRNAQGILDPLPDSAATLDPDGDGVACDDYFAATATSTPRVTGSTGNSTDAQRITALEATVSAQEREIEALTARIDALERQLGLSGTSQPSAVGAHDLTGEVDLIDDYWSGIDAGALCWGRQASDGYAEIDAGQGITVKDENGKVIGAGELQSGAVKVTAGGTGCAFPFSVDGLPEANFYTLSMGRRGDLTFSREEIEARGWHVALSIGD